MSFLNALASGGLSVGLKFYQARYNNYGTQSATEQQSSHPLDDSCPSPPNSVVAPEKKTAPLPAPQSPEEMAQGRADAAAILAEQGVLGQIQRTQNTSETAEKDESAASEAEAVDDEKVEGLKDQKLEKPLMAPGAAPGKKSLTPEEEREIARLQAAEAQIKAQVQAAAVKGAEGAESVRYTYTTGPDDKEYISGVQGGGAGAADRPVNEDLNATAGPQKLSPAEEKVVRELEARDREVRSHEQAHINAAGGAASSPVYQYQTGPDGKRYAIGGHVDVRTGGHNDPEKAAKEAEMLQRAATAPGSPSGPDMIAASQASIKANSLNSDKFAKNMQEAADEEASGLSGLGLKAAGDENSGNVNGYAANAGQIAVDRKNIFNGTDLNQKALGAYAVFKNMSSIQARSPFMALI